MTPISNIQNDDVIEAYMGRYEINRNEALIMSRRETPKERIATYLEWHNIYGHTSPILEQFTMSSSVSIDALPATDLGTGTAKDHFAASETSPPDSGTAALAIGNNRQIGLVRGDCHERGVVDVSLVANAYHELKSQQSASQVWCYDNFTDVGSNSSGLVKSDTHYAEKDCIIWPINHYLGLNRHQTVINAAIEALKMFGTGCGTSAMSGGHSRLHKDVEKRLATWLGKESALLFPTGYSANVGAISGLAKGPSCFILFDRECHASIIDGVKLSGAKYLPFRHNDARDLARKLEKYGAGYENVLVIAESVYSMTGEEACLEEICDLKARHKFLLFVDEAHSFGLHPERTLCAKLGLTDKVDFVMTTLSKSTASIGGVVASNQAFRTLLQVEANAYLFQAAIPPSDVAAIIAAMDVIEETPDLLKSLWAKVEYMRGKLHALGFDIGSGTSPIIPVFIRNSDTLLKMGQDMFARGIFTTSVAYPVVKHSEVRFRFILNESHSYEQIDGTIDVLKELGRLHGVIPDASRDRTANTTFLDISSEHWRHRRHSSRKRFNSTWW